MAFARSSVWVLIVRSKLNLLAASIHRTCAAYAHLEDIVSSTGREFVTALVAETRPAVCSVRLRVSEIACHAAPVVAWPPRHSTRVANARLVRLLDANDSPAARA